AGGDHEVQLDELASLLLEERAHAAARGQPLADAGAAEVAHDAARVDPWAHPDVAIDGAVALLEEEAGMHPAADATVEGQRLADLGEVRLGGGDVVVRARRAERRERRPVLAGRVGTRLGQRRLAVAGHVDGRRQPGGAGRRPRRAVASSWILFSPDEVFFAVTRYRGRVSATALSIIRAACVQLSSRSRWWSCSSSAWWCGRSASRTGWSASSRTSTKNGRRSRT